MENTMGLFTLRPKQHLHDVGKNGFILFKIFLLVKKKILGRLSSNQYTAEFEKSIFTSHCESISKHSPSHANHELRDGVCTILSSTPKVTSCGNGVDYNATVVFRNGLLLLAPLHVEKSRSMKLETCRRLIYRKWRNPPRNRSWGGSGFSV
jgi:hypothetical protein